MSTEIEKCKEFLVSTIRSRRKISRNRISKSASGIRINRLHKLAGELYSAKLLREAIDTLVKEKILLLTCDYYESMCGDISRFHKVKITKVPHVEALSERACRLDEDGNLTIDLSNCRGYSELKVHVLEDGIPRSVLEFTSSLKSAQSRIEKDRS